MIDTVFLWISSSLWNTLVYLLGIFGFPLLSCYFVVKHRITYRVLGILFSVMDVVLIYILVIGGANYIGPTGGTLANILKAVIPVIGVCIIIILPFSTINPWRKREKESK